MKWVHHPTMKVGNTQELIMALSMLRQEPQDIMFSFDIPDTNITTILNAETFPLCNVNAIQQAQNIKVWMKK